jgi:hypothetical protein
LIGIKAESPGRPSVRFFRPSPSRKTGLDGAVMSDLIMVATGLGFFALAILYTLVCEKL